MMVLVLTSVPPGLRGHLTRWLYEVKSGVFVGNLNARLREHIWNLVIERCQGRAIMIVQDRSREQGFAMRTSDPAWYPVDVEGVTLMLRPGG